MINRVKEIKKKGFNMPLASDTESVGHESVDFSKIKVGIRTLEDAVYNLSTYRRINPRLGDKMEVLKAISNNDCATMREISNFFYRTSGIYQRLCKYLAYMYRYDWLVTPYINSDVIKTERVLDGFHKVLRYLDNFEIKKTFGEIALKVIRNGCYYGYLINLTERAIIQELPPQYCRSRFTSADGSPVVEFNMRYFDDAFADIEQRSKMLNLFPEEFKKGYKLYKEGKLVKDFPGDSAGWYLLTTDNVIKFNINGDDFPMLIAVIPAIIDLEEAQALDKKKLQQELLKIIIQKMPIDKNGDLVFDVDEAQALHNNAVRMLAKAIGIDVLTTFADVEVADMSSSGSTTAADDGMDRVKKAVYDQAGVSMLQFNSDGNIALNNSILNDEASLYNLIQQFEHFLNTLVAPFNRAPKKLYYRVEMLSTTIYNYQTLAKMYKDQASVGYSKMLPQIALGHSQSSVLATAYFENDILNLVRVFIPPMSSNTMSADVLTQLGDEKSEGGRPAKEDNEKSEKTIQNLEAQS